jgi:coenzyme F420-0:L-glutamate ligase/coenzyme F420-1:gamma-L-glutamate ligase
MSIRCAPTLSLTALPGIPLVEPGADLPALIDQGVRSAGLMPQDGDVLVVTSKVISRAEGRRVDLRSVEASPRAVELAEVVRKDPRLVELILRESVGVSRFGPDVLIVRHRLGFVTANAGIDASNVTPPGEGSPVESLVLLLPEDPDASAERLRAALSERWQARIAIVVTDSHGRPFRLGTVGTAIGLAGIPALWDQRGQPDLFGRTLQLTVTALGDQVAAAADLVAGQAAEGRPVIHVRGLQFPSVAARASELVRPPGQDLYFRG